MLPYRKNGNLTWKFTDDVADIENKYWGEIRKKVLLAMPDALIVVF